MTDPGASAAGNEQPGVAEAALPDSAGDPQPEAPAGTGASASRFEIAPAFQAGRIDGLAEYLDDVADTIAYARRAAALASAVPRVSVSVAAYALPALRMHQAIAAYALPALQMHQAVSKMAVLSGYGLLKTRLPAFPLAASFPGPVIAPRILPVAPDLDFLQGVSRMVSSWDHGLLGPCRLLAETAVALAAPSQALFRSAASLAAFRLDALGSLANFTGASAMKGLVVDLFLVWRETAETGLGVLRGLARGAYRAALRARAAVLNGDDGPVAWFIEEWLCMGVTPERIEAVGAALLEEGWDAGIPGHPAYLLTDLRGRTVRQARALKPIWETRLNHRTIGMLDRTVTTGDGTPLSVADLVPDPRTTEDLALATEREEQRLLMVLSQLKPDELQVANAYAQGGDLTWAESARLAGEPAAAGERVRRKLKRLGAEHSRRLVQAGGA